MKLSFPLAAIGAALALVVAVPAGAQSPALSPDAAAAAAVVDAFHAALDRGDTATAAGHLADDLLVLEGGAVERSKTEYLQVHLPADAEFSQAVSAERTARTGGAQGEIAWIASEGRAIGTFRGKPVDKTTAETMVLRKAGDGWKITHIHWSSATPQAPR